MTTRIVECYVSENDSIHGPSCEEKIFPSAKLARAYVAEQNARGYWTAMFDNDLELIEESRPEN